MPRGGSRAFVDPDDYEANIRHVEVDLVLTSAGMFKARLTWVDLHQVHLLRSDEELPRIAYVSLAPESVIVAFPIRPDPLPVWAGITMQPSEIVLYSAGARFHQRTDGRCLWSLIAMAPEHLEDYYRVLTGSELDLPSTGRIFQPRARDLSRMRRLHAEACRLAETKPQLLGHTEVARAIEQDLIHALVNCLATENVRGDTAALGRHCEIMGRFEDVLAQHPYRPLHLPDLYEALGVGDRALRSCCSEFLGVSPGRYWHLRRLKLVRTALRQADPTTATVGDLARRYGFSELGRFAVAYRELFGQTPSSTLRDRVQAGIYIRESRNLHSQRNRL
jgi:AraC-like DNA-binding protein